MGEIFIKLLNMSITAGWMILAVLCIRFLFRKMPKWVTCLLWGLVAIRLICPFSIESGFSLQPSAEPLQSAAVVEGELMHYVPSIDSSLTVVENAVNPILAEAFAYEEADSVAPLQVLTWIAGNVWLLGMLVLLVFAAVSVVRLRLSVREAVCYRENIYLCDSVSSPFILGIISPVIYLSSDLNEAEMDYIISHEKAHLRRLDHLWKPLGYLLLCVYWFNPLCWLAYVMLCKDIELACDERVIKNMTFADKKEYSRVLLSCATRKRMVLSCPLAFGEVGVKERVRTVLNYKTPAFWITVTAVVACVLVAVCFLTNPPEKPTGTASFPTEEDAEGTEALYTEEINVERRDVTHDGVPDYIVTSMNYDLKDMDSNATLKEKLARQLTQDVICVEVYEGEEDSDTYLEKEPLWSEEYSWVHVGNGQLNIVRLDGKDYLLASSFWVGQGVADLYFEVFSLNSAGEKEVMDLQSIELEEMVEGDTVRFQAADEIVLKNYRAFKKALEQYTEDGILLVACDIDMEEQLVRTSGQSYNPQDYYELGFAKLHVMEVHAQNLQEHDEMQTLQKEQEAAGFMAVSDVSGIVAINGNTGERRMLTSRDNAYNDLIKLYTQLDLTTEYVENTRVGYQYCMILQDADGNKLQTLTPYKDGLTVDNIFYQYDVTGEAAAGSLRLMEYLEYMFMQE